MSSPSPRCALRIKTNSHRGGAIENIGFSKVTVGQVAEAVTEVDFFWEEGGPFRPVVNNVVVSDVTCKKSKYGLFLRGYKNAPIRGFNVSDCTFENAAWDNLLENVELVKITRVMVNGKAVLI
jgi:hypothetical protein